VAKAQFHRHQRVWVECVGAWAVIEKIVPVWAKGFGEPVRITYDVGMGREFLASELRAEQASSEPSAEISGPWRVVGARNKWQQPEDCAHHPYPGTYPVVVTDTQDWGGWRVPGAEYDRDPHQVETQARIIVSAPRLLKLAADLQKLVADAPEDAPMELRELSRRAADILRHVADAPPPPAPPEPARPTRLDALREEALVQEKSKLSAHPGASRDPGVFSEVPDPLPDDALMPSHTGSA
jgi:hypothetical protein